MAAVRCLLCRTVISDDTIPSPDAARTLYLLKQAKELLAQPWTGKEYLGILVMQHMVQHAAEQAKWR